jgi:hypothetical protein
VGDKWYVRNIQPGPEGRRRDDGAPLVPPPLYDPLPISAASELPVVEVAAELRGQGRDPIPTLAVDDYLRPALVSLRLSW